MTEFSREELIKKITSNLGQPNVKAYLDPNDPRHKEVVDQVTAIVEQHLGQSHPHMGLMESNEQSIRQALYDDPRDVDQQIKDILNGHDEKWSKPYFDGGHPLHREAVTRMNFLSEAKFDNQPHAPEIFPTITKTGEANMKQADLVDPAFQSTQPEGEN